MEKNDNLSPIICPACKSVNTFKKEIREDNGIIGSGFYSWVVDSWHQCKDCGIRFDIKTQSLSN